MMEEVLADYDAAYCLNSVCLRYFNAAGGFSGRRPHISVFGRDYETPNGTCIRDYLHIADLCEAHWLALQSLMHGGPSQAYNLGNCNGFSVEEVIDTAEVVTGRKIVVENA